MKITISDIAEKANVSKMTVSRVLNERGQVAKKTANRVKQIINELGYQPNLIARSLSSKCSMTIGVIIPKINHIFLDNYVGEISSGITDVALERNYRISLFPIKINKDRNFDYINIMRSRVVDGLIILKAKKDDPNLELLVENNISFVLVNYKKYKKTYNFVDTKNVQAAEMAVNYFYNRGYKNIAIINGSMDETNSVDRLKGYKMALTKLGLEYKPEWVLFSDFTKEKAYEVAGKLLNLKKKPNAIFCCADYIAIGAMERLKKEGLSIPGDMAIIGFDDIELAAYLKPALTTIRQPLYELGLNAGKILLNIIEEKQKTPVHKFLKVKLIERDSC